MGIHTGIGWTDHTFNHVWGCAKISAGCAHCYADTFQHWLGMDVFGYNPDGTRKALRTFGDKHWAAPLRWQQAAAQAGVRRRVFCASMADVFDAVPEAAPHRERLWTLIQATPDLDWLLLTKRPEHIASMLPADWGQGYANVWLGTSVEHQAATCRIAHLQAVPAVRRFLSCEPLLEAVRLTNLDMGGIQWVIVGGESGPHARRMDAAWLDQMLGDLDHLGVVPFVKQTGTALARELGLKHPKGEDPAEWPADWQRQEFPEGPVGRG